MDRVFWITDRLAGRCGPAEQQWDLQKLHQAGFRAIISLDEKVDEKEIAEKFDHFPLYLPDVALSTVQLKEKFLKTANRFCDIVSSYNEPILVHCYAGNDRTGAMLACFLISQGKSAEEAIAEVKRQNANAMRTPGYEEVVYLFAQLR